VNLKLAAAALLAMLSYVNASIGVLDYLSHDVQVTITFVAALVSTGLAMALGVEFMAAKRGNGGG